LHGHDDRVRSIAFSPNKGERVLATGSNDQTIRLWDLDRPPGDPPAVLGGQEEWVRAVAFSPDGRTLAASSADGTVRLWTVRTADLVALVCDTVSRDLGPDEQKQFLVGKDEPACPTPTPAGG
jgi:WD40 repeat protein